MTPVASTATVVLDYLRVLAWPVVAVALAVFFLRLFRVELGDLIKRLRSAHLFGVAVTATEVDAQRQVEGEPSDEEEADADAIIAALIEGHQAELAEAEQTSEELAQELSSTQIALEFERIYCFILGSQMQALREMRAAGHVGLPVMRALGIYGAVLANNQEAFANFSFEQWAAYLLRERGDMPLVAVNQNGNYVATAKGIAFVGYIEALGYPERGL